MSQTDDEVHHHQGAVHAAPLTCDDAATKKAKINQFLIAGNTNIIISSSGLNEKIFWSWSFYLL